MLRQIGEKHFAPLMDRPEARALWWPRFLRIASWFAGWETERRLNVKSIDAEIRGEIPIRLDNGRSFTLTARADRIEHRTDRTYAILDYKTGAPPTAKQVRMGLSPQLTLEAAILREGGFEGIAAGGSVSELLYVRLSGNNPPGKSILLELKVNKGDAPQFPDDAADEARRKLEALIRAFENEDQAYTSLNLSMDQPLVVLTTRRGSRNGAPVSARTSNECAPAQHPEAVRATRASDPASSVFVSANAGSARLHVLVQRDQAAAGGVPPEKILCIASPGRRRPIWQAGLHHLGLGHARRHRARCRDRDRYRAARRLRSRARNCSHALETPGGLKVQTIHALCAAAAAFPFEANVPARFGWPDEHQAE